MLRSSLFLALIAAGLGLGQAALAQPDTPIAGRWRDSDGESEIAIARCGEAWCGKIVWLKQPRVDQANPDAKLRERSLMGVQVLSGFKPDGSGRFAGAGYNPEDGKTYNTTLQPDGAGKLLVRGCAIAGLICDDDVWTRQP